jgi:hypothetical protein
VESKSYRTRAIGHERRYDASLLFGVRRFGFVAAERSSSSEVQ